MEITEKRISFTFVPRDMLLSLQTGISFVRVAVACGILERISGFEPSSETTDACYGTEFLSFHLDLPLDAVSAICHQPDLLSTDLHLIPCAGFIEAFS